MSSYFGMATDARMPRITMTITSSIRVKPASFLGTVLMISSALLLPDCLRTGVTRAGQFACRVPHDASHGAIVCVELARADRAEPASYWGLCPLRLAR